LLALPLAAVLLICFIFCYLVYVVIWPDTTHEVSDGRPTTEDHQPPGNSP
jgi:hypothetical protein